ncbi:MAG: flagellar hook-length control protein FliK [Desulfobulbus sp.]|nr:flagellar hook-length control protein FliK [Desulfobulbus sp.]
MIIPADLASQLRATLQPAQQDAPAPAIPIQKLTDALSGLTPGQRIFAEIQAMLPNGAYRAMVAQRDVTLALPFSAKPGDSLELEVLESDGKLTLAFVANRTSGQQAADSPGQSVATTLSAAGRLIGGLLGRVDDGGARAAPAPLNGNLPLTKGMPDAAQLAPILKEALSQSGVFYEAHQARWAAGQLPTEALRQEPQGKQPSTPPPSPPPAAPGREATAPVRGEPAQTPMQAAQQGNLIPRELTPIVQQQLDALATQNYAWQGQIWQEQKMWWEISQESDQASGDDDPGQHWQTRLKLSLPALGGIEARLRLRPGGRVDLQMTADSDAGETRLRDHLDSLRERFAAAGLDLTQLLLQHGEIPA